MLKTISEEGGCNTSPHPSFLQERLNNFFGFSKVLESSVLNNFCYFETVDKKADVDNKWLKNIKG